MANRGSYSRIDRRSRMSGASGVIKAIKTLPLQTMLQRELREVTRLVALKTTRW